MIKSSIDDKSHNKFKDKIESEEEIEISNEEKEGEEIIQKLNKNFIIEINLIVDKKKVIFIIKTSSMQIKI